MTNHGVCLSSNNFSIKFNPLTVQLDRFLNISLSGLEHIYPHKYARNKPKSNSYRLSVLLKARKTVRNPNEYNIDGVHNHVVSNKYSFKKTISIDRCLTLCILQRTGRGLVNFSVSVLIEISIGLRDRTRDDRDEFDVRHVELSGFGARSKKYFFKILLYWCY